MKKAEQIETLTKEIETLNPTDKELEEYPEKNNNKQTEYFIVNNAWREKKSLHIHIGSYLNLYLNVAQARDFIKWIKKQREDTKT